MKEKNEQKKEEEIKMLIFSRQHTKKASSKNIESGQETHFFSSSSCFSPLNFSRIYESEQVCTNESCLEE